MKGFDTVESLSAGARGSIFLSMQDLPKVGLLYEVYKLCQNISTTIGFTKIRAFVYKCGQKISTYVGFTKIRAFVGK